MHYELRGDIDLWREVLYSVTDALSAEREAGTMVYTGSQAIALASIAERAVVQLDRLTRQAVEAPDEQS